MENAEKISCEQEKIGIQKQGQECVRGLPLLSEHLHILITSENDFSEDHCMKVSYYNFISSYYTELTVYFFLD